MIHKITFLWRYWAVIIIVTAMHDGIARSYRAADPVLRKIVKINIPEPNQAFDFLSQR